LPEATAFAVWGPKSAAEPARQRKRKRADIGQDTGLRSRARSAAGGADALGGDADLRPVGGEITGGDGRITTDDRRDHRR
jgi:hypothetical protein